VTLKKSINADWKADTHVIKSVTSQLVIASDVDALFARLFNVISAQFSLFVPRTVEI